MRFPLLCILVFISIYLGFAQKPMFSSPLSPRLANYTIDVSLDAHEKQLTGMEILNWKNDSNDFISELRFHMYLNAFKNEATTFVKESGGKLRGADIKKDGGWGWTVITRMATADGLDLTSNMKYIQPDDGNEMDETVLQVLLDDPIPPGGKITLNIDFIAQLPQIFARTGYTGDFILAGQWFPKIGVYEQAGERYATRGQWNCHQFHGNTEFYADFGVYDVKISVPKEYTVGATGMLLEKHLNEDGTQTWRYYCEDVHDFAWTADTDFIVVEDTWKHVKIKYMVQPLRESAALQHIQAAKNALEFCEEWFGPYPYPVLTIVDPQYGGLGAGGMEYPTFITVGMFWLLPDGIKLPEETVVHEFAHNYWYGMVANNEFEEAWLDEGFTTYSELKIMDKFYSQNAGSTIDLFGLEIDNRDNIWGGYSSRPMRDKIVKFAWKYDRGGYGSLTYYKSAMFLYTLEKYLGEEKMKEILQTYFNRYKFSHPATKDFIQIVNMLTQQNLSDFIQNVLYGTKKLDYAIDRISIKRIEKMDDGIFGNPLQDTDSINVDDDTSVAAEEDTLINDTDEKMYENKVIVERLGGIRLPAEILIKFNNGEEILENWDGQDRFHVYKYIRSSKIVSAQLDPQRKIWLDVNFLNNSKTMNESRAATLKYSTRWLFWMQNLLTVLSIFS